MSMGAVHWTRTKGDTGPALDAVLRYPTDRGQRVGTPRNLTGDLVVGTIRRWPDRAIIQQTTVVVIDAATGKVELPLSLPVSEADGLHLVSFEGITPAGGRWSFPGPLNPWWLLIASPVGAGSSAPAGGTTWTNRGLARLLAGTFDPAGLELGLLTVAPGPTVARLWNTEADIVAEMTTVQAPSYARRPLPTPAVTEDDATGEALLDYGDVSFGSLEAGPVSVAAVVAVEVANGDVMWVAELPGPLAPTGAPFLVMFPAVGAGALR